MFQGKKYLVILEVDEENMIHEMKYCKDQKEVKVFVTDLFKRYELIYKSQLTIHTLGETIDTETVMKK